MCNFSFQGLAAFCVVNPSNIPAYIAVTIFKIKEEVNKNIGLIVGRECRGW
jgi:hypothetical protein